MVGARVRGFYGFDLGFGFGPSVRGFYWFGFRVEFAGQGLRFDFRVRVCVGFKGLVSNYGPFVRFSRSLHVFSLNHIPRSFLSLCLFLISVLSNRFSCSLHTFFCSLTFCSRLSCHLCFLHLFSSSLFRIFCIFATNFL